MEYRSIVHIMQKSKKALEFAEYTLLVRDKMFYFLLFHLSWRPTLKVLAIHFRIATHRLGDADVEHTYVWK